MNCQGFLYELFQISVVKWLCEPKSFISFKLTFTVLPGYLNFSVADVATNVADVTLCEWLLSIEDKSGILYCSWSQHGFYMKYHLHLSMLFAFWACKNLLVHKFLSWKIHVYLSLFRNLKSQKKPLTGAQKSKKTIILAEW